jgi:hypothetical protein
MTKDEALKMAMDELYTWIGDDVDLNPAWKACKEALEPEPMTTTDVITCKMAGKCCMTGEALEQPAWQGLTDDEIDYWECLKAPPVHSDFLEDDSWREFARCIETALKDKNT